MKYYLITCMRGHCGRGRGIEISFAIVAKDLISAQEIARRMPGVKHTRMILCGREITFEQYEEYKQMSAYDRIYKR